MKTNLSKLSLILFFLSTGSLTARATPGFGNGDLTGTGRSFVDDSLHIVAPHDFERQPLAKEELRIANYFPQELVDEVELAFYQNSKELARLRFALDREETGNEMKCVLARGFEAILVQIEKEILPYSHVLGENSYLNQSIQTLEKWLGGGLKFGKQIGDEYQKTTQLECKKGNASEGTKS